MLGKSMLPIKRRVPTSIWDSNTESIYRNDALQACRFMSALLVVPAGIEPASKV